MTDEPSRRELPIDHIPAWPCLIDELDRPMFLLEAARQFLAPDLAFLFYLVSARIGAVAYNALHTTLGPLALAALAAWAGWGLGEALALIWLANVGVDRALGYGLKYATGFGDTHLGRIGAAAR